MLFSNAAAYAEVIDLREIQVSAKRENFIGLADSASEGIITQ